MRFNGITWVLLLALSLSFVLAQIRLFAQPSRAQAASGGDAKVSIFFDAVKAMDVGEIRTNALTALKAKGYTVPRGASCVINVAVLGPKPGCAVMFWDLEAKWKYQVEFNSQGEVSEIWAGPMRHGTVGPNDPLPKVPEGGVKVKP
jgi:hypothetical protein